MKVGEEELTKNIHAATSLKLVNVRNKNIGVIAVAIAISAGSLVGKIPLTGRLYLITTLGLQVVTLFLYVFHSQLAFDYVHFRLMGPLLCAGIFMPGRQIAWATLITAMLFITVWITYDGTCIFQKRLGKALLYSKWTVIFVVFLCASRLLCSRNLPWWSWVFGVCTATLVFCTSNLFQTPTQKNPSVKSKQENETEVG